MSRMIQFELYTENKTGEDELGNPLHSFVPIHQSLGRFSPFSSEEIDLEGREVVKTKRKFMTLASLDICKQADSLKVEGEHFDILKVKEYRRWRVLYLKRYKG